MANNTEIESVNWVNRRRASLLAIAAVFCAFFTMGTGAVLAQTSAEMFSSSIPVIPTGPTTANQTATLFLNPDNPTGNTVGAASVNVTASITNQQFTGVNTGAGSPVFMFGATVNTTTTTPVSEATFRPMNIIGSPANSQFSSLSSGSPMGMDVTVNHAFNIFTSVQQWTAGPLGGDPLTNARVYMADLTLTFSSPINNPLLQIVGVGGTSPPSLGFATELTLTTPGLTLSQLQGSNLLVTSSQVNNSNLVGITVSCAQTPGAGCGTVRINGTGISTVTFQVFVRGDGGSPTWSGPAVHAGDQWMLGVSIPSGTTAAGAEIAGRVQSADGRALSNVNVSILNTSNNEIRSTRTNAFGYYTFSDLPVSTFYILTARDKKRGLYATRSIQLFDAVDDLNFVFGEEGSKVQQ